MKPNSPSLYLYFTACILVVTFKILDWDIYVLYAKSLIIPLLFIYFFITNHYKIKWDKVLIFLFCFIGDIFNLFNFNVSPLGALFSFLIVYLLLLKLSYYDFKGLKFDIKDRFPILISFLIIAIATTAILSLKFEKIAFDFSLYIIYGVVLSLLIFISFVNYMKKPNYAFLNLVLMCVCSMVSDVFFMINKFYLSIYAFSFIQVSIQVFSYYFMVTYFIENDKYLLRTKNI